MRSGPFAHLDAVAHDAQFAEDGFDRMGVDHFQHPAGRGDQCQIGQLCHVSRNAAQQFGQ